VRTGYSTSAPAVPAIPGYDLPHVLTAADVLSGEHSVGNRVLVIEDDPHVQAATAAEFLADSGRSVTIVSRATTIGISIDPVNQGALYSRLYKAGVELLPDTWIREIGPTSVCAYNVYSEQERALEGYDTVVLATGNRVRDDLYHRLRDELPELEAVRVGDCLAPRKLDHAIWEGFHAGRTV
jgi:pyruvate/2-oxoglutarate dehydrogenase complex dihydrolipoamide dehydrogenase (E3) component